MLYGTIREKEECNPAVLVTKRVLFCHVMLYCLLGECLIVSCKCLLEHQPVHWRVLQQLAALQEQKSPFLAHTPTSTAVIPLLGSHTQIRCSSVETLEWSVYLLCGKGNDCVKRGLSLELCVCAQARIFRVRDHDRVQ